MAAGAGAVAVLMLATETRALAWVVVGLLYGTLMVYRRTVQGQPFAYWAAWLVGAVVAGLMAWTHPFPFDASASLILLPLAGLQMAVALVLFCLWYSRRR